MRLSATVIIFSSCFIYANSRTYRENELNFDTNKNTLNSLITCVKYLGLSKCISGYGVWRAETALKTDGKLTSEYGPIFPWQSYNKTDEELYSELFETTNTLLQNRSLDIPLNEDFSLQLGTTGDLIKIDVVKNDDTATGRSTMKKLTKQFYAMMPFILLPGLIMSAVLPFFLPTLKMMTIATGMLNKMALTGAVFTLLRNNAFNDKYEKKVIYVNNGYANDKYQQLSNSPPEVLIDTSFADKLKTYSSDDIKDFSLIGGKPIDVDYQVTPSWLQGANEGFGKLRNVQILGGNFLNPWRKQDDVGDRNE